MAKLGVRELQLREARERDAKLRGGGESGPALKPPADSLARQQRPSEVPSRREQLAGTGGAAGGVLKAPIAGVASGPRKFKRPRLEDRDKTITANAPWKALGMSRRTWYRRRAEGKA